MVRQWLLPSLAGGLAFDALGVICRVITEDNLDDAFRGVWLSLALGILCSFLSLFVWKKPSSLLLVVGALFSTVAALAIAGYVATMSPSAAMTMNPLLGRATIVFRETIFPLILGVSVASLTRGRFADSRGTKAHAA